MVGKGGGLDDRSPRKAARRLGRLQEVADAPERRVLRVRLGDKAVVL